MKYFSLYSTCVPVKGINRSLICDLERGQMILIPNELFEIFTLMKEKELTIEETKAYYSQEYNEGIDNFFNFLKDKKVGNYFNYLLKDELSLEFDSPSSITNAILDFSKDSEYDYKTAISKIIDLNCHYFQLRFYYSPDQKILKNILKQFDDSPVRYISLVVGHHDYMTDDFLLKLQNDFMRLSNIVIYESIKDDFNYLNSTLYIRRLKKSITSEKCCGNFSLDYFANNIRHFSESQKNNTCLNKKISVDKNGCVKNCPSMMKDFGRIESLNLVAVLDNLDFTKLWDINKDKIHVCKDCEYRHICTDCRAYLEDPEDLLSKPLKCGYNPYFNIWEEWSTNPLKNKALQHYQID